MEPNPDEAAPELTEKARIAADLLTDAIDAYLTTRSEVLGETQSLLGDWVLSIEVQTALTEENPMGDNAIMIIARPTTTMTNARKLIRGAAYLLAPEIQKGE